MSKAKVTSGFSTNNYSDSDLHVKAGTIVDKLSVSRPFNSLADLVTEIRTQNDLFGEYLKRTQAGDRQVTVEKNNARIGLEGLLGKGALRVQDISGGDEALILSSGYEINQKKTAAGELDMPVTVIVKQGVTTGSLDITWEVVPHAYSYEVRYTASPKTAGSVYMTQTTTKHKITIENLTPGTTYCIQVAGVGADPKRVWSVEVISCYVS
jgi:hypothetical protein